MADLTQTPTSVVTGTGAAASIVDALAGTTIAAGNAVYIDTAGAVQKCATDSAVHANAKGVALNGGATGQPIRVQTSGQVNLGATLTVGEIYTVADTAGAIRPHADNGAGDFVTILGVGISSTICALGINASGVAHA